MLVLNIHYLFKNINNNFVYLGMSMGNGSEWNRQWEIFLNEQDAQEKEKFRDALTASKETSILNR